MGQLLSILLLQQQMVRLTTTSAVITFLDTDVKFFMVLPFISIVDTYNFDVVTLSETDDGGSDNITIPELIGFPFGNTSQSLVFVSHI